MPKNESEDLARSLEGENDPGFKNPMDYLILGAMIGHHEMLLQQARDGSPEGAIAFLEKCQSRDPHC